MMAELVANNDQATKRKYVKMIERQERKRPGRVRTEGVRQEKGDQRKEDGINERRGTGFLDFNSTSKFVDKLQWFCG